MDVDRKSKTKMSSSFQASDALTTDASGFPVTVIEPASKRYLPDLGELWRFRNLYRALVWRNLKVRYRSTALGAVWILLQPLLRMVIYTIIFGLWARIQVEGIPYSLHVLSGIVLMFFLTNIIGESANAIRSNSNLTKKVYFPKLILPIVLTTSGAVDLFAAVTLLFLFMSINGVWPSVAVLLFPCFLILVLAWGFTMSVWFTALGIQYRDVSQVTPVVSMLFMYMTPVIYPITMVPDKILPIYALNPMVGIVSGFRWAVLGVGPFYGWTLVISVVEILVLGVIGIIYFLRTERGFNDYV